MPVTFLVGLVAYLTLFPEIEQKPSTQTTLPREQHSFAAVMRVLREDEKVVELLMNAGRTMFQRDIARKACFSRVKTHRVLYRLSTREVLTA